MGETKKELENNENKNDANLEINGINVPINLKWIKKHSGKLCFGSVLLALVTGAVWASPEEWYQ